MSPILLWAGLSTGSQDAQDLAAIDQFFKGDFLRALESENADLAHSRHYELLAPDRHKGFGSQYLVGFDFVDEEVADRSAREDVVGLGSAPNVWKDNVTIDWMLAYRFVADTNAESVAPYAIYLVGVDPPANIDAPGLEEFNEFYTNVHLPEVGKRRRASRSSRYELWRDVIHPAEGTPRFVAIYDVDEKATTNTRHIGFGYTKGPTVWQKHKTPWRLWYRLLSA